MSETVLSEPKTPVIRLEHITKRFGHETANDDVSLSVYPGEILSVLGENGSGKTTLMNIIAGIYYPDSGRIFVNGKEVFIRSPKVALKYKIGMVHQHFKLVDVFTSTENIILGLEHGGRFDLKSSAARVREISEQYGFDIDPDRKVYEMSVSEKQTVEIIKVLYRGADILILDEPTAVLTPQETEKLFAVLRKMREDGKTIIIITHKLNEVLSLSDKVAVLCKGRYIGTVKTSETNEAKLTEMMVGRKVKLDIDRPSPKDRTPRMELIGVSCTARDGSETLHDVGFTAYSGEILGIAGIAGSGQRELLEAIAGLQEFGGEITYHIPGSDRTESLRGKTPLEIQELGVRLSFVPEDRLGMGLIGNMDLVDNVMLRSYRGGRPFFLSRKKPRALADKIIRELEVATPGASTAVRRLSGGNVQKVLVGREISSSPALPMAAYPVRGLDINASFAIYRLLNKQKEQGTAVIFVGEDLDVMLALCDRILVLCSGRVSGIVDAKKATKEQLGLMMTRTAADLDKAKAKKKKGGTADV